MENTVKVAGVPRKIMIDGYRMTQMRDRSVSPAVLQRAAKIREIRFQRELRTSSGLC